MIEKIISVAIDGPSGAGKSTIAKSAARRFGLTYVDTGAIYRTVGIAAYRAGISPVDVHGISGMLSKIQIELRHDAGGQRMYLDGEDVTERLRDHEISRYASDVSAIPQVREFLLEMQRSLAREQSVIMDGRDIGTVVLPGATLKVFLTADMEERALRRHRELCAAGSDISYEQVLRDIESRDKNDSGRQAAPLKAAEDSVLVDTTDITLKESEELICALIAEKLGI